MAKRSFAGDAKYRLPKGKVEPYRLWFEYLKLAYQYPNIEVDTSLYASWGNIVKSHFGAWWSEHWSKLFATYPETRLISSVDAFKEAAADPKCVVIRVSLTSPRKQRIKDIDDALKVIPTAEVKEKRSTSDPAFVIASKRSINYATLRGMLRYLRFFNDNDWDIDKASVAYYKWSKTWNDRVRTKKLKVPAVYVPPFLPVFVDRIAEKTKSVGGLKKRSNPRGYDDLRSQARRLLRRGETILQNVGEGRFPGSF